MLLGIRVESEAHSLFSRCFCVASSADVALSLIPKSSLIDCGGVAEAVQESVPTFNRLRGEDYRDFRPSFDSNCSWNHEPHLGSAYPYYQKLRLEDSVGAGFP